MMIDRRQFLRTVAGGSAASLAFSMNSKWSSGAATERAPQELDRELNKILLSPVLQLSHLNEPIKIASIELLRTGVIHE